MSSLRLWYRTLVVLLLGLGSAMGAQASSRGEVAELETAACAVPHIPEPLLFDLMRPMHARRGELEINTLATVSASGPIRWAPEVEYAVADGVGIEFEAPWVGGYHKATKFGFQFRMGYDQRSIHGVQVLAEKEASSQPGTAVTALYLLGHRFSDEWSLLSMSGAEAGFGSGVTEWKGVQNLSLFRTWSETVTTGLEINWKFSSRDLSDQLAVTPQVHWAWDRNWMVQAGVGVAKRNTGERHRWEPQFTLRLITQL